MNKKLAKYFAQNACDNAMEKLVSLFDSSFTGDFDVQVALEKIREADRFDAMKRNQMTGLDQLKERIKQRQEQLQKEMQEEAEAKEMNDHRRQKQRA